MNKPQKCTNDLERSKFCNQVQSFVCVQPLKTWGFKFWEMLKNASEVTIVQKKIPNIIQICAQSREVRSKPG
jgi:hypothetical protein